MKELEKCIRCNKELKPHIESKNFITGKWDEHSYIPCECMEAPKNAILSIG